MSIVNLFRRLKLDRWFFTILYWRGRPPWDTGISPPELTTVVEGEHALPPGRALDIGCGTGTNTLYLARHGWQAVGVDFAAPAIARANAKLQAAEHLAGSARFIQGDASQLEKLDIGAPCSLLLDMGCFHGIPVEDRPKYVAGVAHYARPGALFLLYAFGPRTAGKRRLGVTPAEVRDLFGSAFDVERVSEGTDRGMLSTWYWLRRNAER